jgi:hypothetical protein
MSVITNMKAAAVLIAILVSSGCSSAKAAQTIPISGTVTLVDSDSAAAWAVTNKCTGAGGYSDIKTGAEVVISDDGGKTLAISSLTAPMLSGDVAGRCIFGFAADVPPGKHFYSVTVTHRGAVKFAEDALPTAALTIGG